MPQRPVIWRSDATSRVPGRRVADRTLRALRLPLKNQQLVLNWLRDWNAEGGVSPASLTRQHSNELRVLQRLKLRFCRECLSLSCNIAPRF